MRRQQFQGIAPNFDALFRKKRDSVERRRNARKYRQLRAGTLLCVDERRRGVDWRRNCVDKPLALVLPVFLDCQGAGLEKTPHLFREIPLSIPVTLVFWELGEDRGSRIVGGPARADVLPLRMNLEQRKEDLIDRAPVGCVDDLGALTDDDAIAPAKPQLIATLRIVRLSCVQSSGRPGPQGQASRCRRAERRYRGETEKRCSTSRAAVAPARTPCRRGTGGRRERRRP